VQTVAEPKALIGQLIAGVERAMVGKRREIEYVLVALLAGGHVLVEDVPGVGKTTLVRALATTLGCSFRRIQFTPDLLPSDVTGVSVYNQATSQFEFRPGPVFSQILLADEINRTSPKTQSALLESLEERQVTIDGVSHPLPSPFLVLATQNPIEYEGTFPLPEAQLDRFLLRIRLGYPTPAEEKQVLLRRKETVALDAVCAPRDVLALQEAARGVHVTESVLDYLVGVVQATRSHADLYLGASPRASIALYEAGRALAFVRGRDYVTPDDIKELAPLVLAHRLILKPEATLRGATADSVVADVLTRVAVPMGGEARARRG
jgi:MoxR-like ATPase